MTLTPRISGWIEVICGPMFSGKTEELIRRLVRAQIAKQRVAIFKPNTDNRFAENYIVSHNQRKIKSIQVEQTNTILDYEDKADVFGIDEAQFFDSSIIKICGSDGCSLIARTNSLILSNSLKVAVKTNIFFSVVIV